MSVLRIVGEELIAEEDYRSIASEQPAYVSEMQAAFLPAQQDVTPYVPIGPGKPLTIEIRHVYTGKYPKNGLFGSHKDVAVVSGVRDYSVFAATARALNFIERGQKARSNLKTPSAFNDGTPVVAHYPALATDSLTLSIEIAVDDFPQDFVDELGGAFETLGGVPLMLPYTGFLLGAGEILKLAGGIGNALFDGQPEFSMTDPLNFNIPGSIIPTADFRLLTQSDVLRLDYKYDDAQGLVHKQTGARYDGDDPYVVISLDGAPRPSLAEFAATAASASILKRFFNIGADTRTPIATIVEGIKLASDMRFRDKAIAVKKALDALPADSPDRAKLQLQYEALRKNIGNDVLKLKD